MKRDMMNLFGTRGLARLAVCALLSLSGAWSAWGGAGNTAPINPRFIEWQKINELQHKNNQVVEGQRPERNQKRQLLSATPTSESEPVSRFLGYVPDIVDYGYLKDINYQGESQTGVLSNDPLPKSFDLRDRGGCHER